MSNNDGGPAFPAARYEEVMQAGVSTWMDVIYPGLSLRDWFAGQSINGLMLICAQDSDHADYPTYEAYIATLSYRMADALIAERAKGAKL